MARRSIAKRLLRTGASIKKSTFKTIAKMQAGYTNWANDIAGPEIVERVKNCQKGELCACREAKDTYIKTAWACSPHRIDRYRDEYQEFKERVVRPGDYTVADLKNWAVILFAAFGAWYLGVVIGRWNLWGFKYEGETIE